MIITNSMIGGPSGSLPFEDEDEIELYNFTIKRSLDRGEPSSDDLE